MDKELLKYAVEYLEKKVDGFKYQNKTKKFFTCPVCPPNSQVKNTCTASFKNSGFYFVTCNVCGFKGNIFDLVRKIEKDKEFESDQNIAVYLKKFLSVKIVQTSIEVDDIFAFYKSVGFDLVPIAANSKRPYEKDWTKKSHKDVDEWHKWFDNSLNVGVKTGLMSNITVLDVDSTKLPKVFQEILDKNNTLIQKTGKGYHFFFKYDASIPKSNFKLDGVHIDVQNDGGQVVVYPSKIDKTERFFLNRPDNDGDALDRLAPPDLPTPTRFNNIIVLPEHLKNLILEKIGRGTVTSEEVKGSLADAIKSDEPKELSEDSVLLKNNNLEGCCNSTFLKIGGILRKELSIKETSFALNVLNKHLLERPMDKKSMDAMVMSLSKYDLSDDKELASRIYKYIKLVEFANSREISEAVKEEKERVEGILSRLVQEQLLIKKGRNYWAIKRLDWTDTFPSMLEDIPFKIPYFHDFAHFNWGDIVLLGSKTKNGKTTIAINIIKKLIEQGVKPDYIYCETGGRFMKAVRALGISEGQFNRAFASDPTKILLEPNAVTILDWLVIDDFTSTQTIFRNFADQLNKTNGILIVFMQLKKNGDWFAPNLVDLFCSLGARYVYDDEKDGSKGKWHIDVVRDAKLNMKKAEIPCVYNWESRRLEMLEEVVKKTVAEKPEPTLI